MGVQMFNGSCNFPGIGDFYVDAINQPVPAEPAALSAPPSEPAIPPAPTPPADKYNQVQMVQYLNALSAYQDNVKAIQGNYRNEMNLYQAMSDVYAGEMSKYQEDIARYNISRVSAVKGGEGIIEIVTEKYGWAWVNKNDPKIFIPWLLKDWLSQIEIVIVYLGIILFLIKRKDVK
jgi:hypothetical protein